MAKKLWEYLICSDVLKKGAARKTLVPCKVSTSLAPMKASQGFGAHQKLTVTVTIAEKIQEKSSSFDRYILRFFAILQCEF
jgi:hypothetical protein